MRVPAELLYSCFSKTAQKPQSRSAEKEQDFRLRDIFSLGGLGAALGTGYLANKGVENLLKLRAPGSFRTQLEQGILAQHNKVQADQLNALSQQLKNTRNKVTNRNLLLGGALALGAAPLLFNYLSQD
jgi:hypothetical protein